MVAAAGGPWARAGARPMLPRRRALQGRRQSPGPENQDPRHDFQVAGSEEAPRSLSPQVGGEKRKDGILPAGSPVAAPRSMQTPGAYATQYQQPAPCSLQPACNPRSTQQDLANPHLARIVALRLEYHLPGNIYWEFMTHTTGNSVGEPRSRSSAPRVFGYHGAFSVTMTCASTRTNSLRSSSSDRYYQKPS